MMETNGTSEYDVVVIGSGTAGQTAAYELIDHGLRVAVVEHGRRPGGTCALSGCQAKKWFYEAAETVARSRHLSGIGMASSATADWASLRNAKNLFTDRVPSNTVEGFKKAGIDFIEGHARFSGKTHLEVGGKNISAGYIIVASGAAPMPLPMEGSNLLITSTEFLELDRLPSRIVFVGGGFISFEFAHFAARIGPPGIKCTILEAGPRPLSPFDGEMVDLLSDASRSEGIDIQNNMNITWIERNRGSFLVHTDDGQLFGADLVIHGAGRRPNIEDLDLDRAGIEFSRRGIAVNEQMATSNDRVYAVGDCAATVQLARVADAEARVTAINIANRIGGKEEKAIMAYESVPSVLFTYPQYGMVGATEQALTDQGVDYQKSFAKELAWPTYRRVGLKSAAYKILADRSGRILGAHILSDNATGLINAITLSMRNGLTAEDLYRQSVMTPYPSRESDILYMLKPLL